MSGIFDEKNRQVIPRWLDYSASCSIGLLRHIRKQEEPNQGTLDNPRVIEDWKTNPNLFSAVDLLAEALIIKNFVFDEAIKAAQLIIRDAPSSSILIRELAKHFLEPPVSIKLESSQIGQPNYIKRLIGQIKKSVRTHPLNPVAWSELSLYYATLGHTKKSKQSMQVALSLGGNNPFILRSASRCFMHIGEPNHAVTILRDSELCSFNPWVASAEIAISEVMGFRSKCVDKGRRMIRDDNFAPFSRSELAACLGTMEIKRGATRRAKALLQQALRNPSENALAQAVWMAIQLGTEIPHLETKVPASYEAKACHLYRAKQYFASLSSTELWSRFQLFSSRPLVLASFLASVCINDDKRAICIIENAAPATWGDPLLINNYAFALARSGNLSLAVEVLRNIDMNDLTGREKFILSATQGLISFRSGEKEKARELYYNAVRGLDRIHESRSAAIATYFWATEEKLIGSSHATYKITEAKKRVKRSGVFEIEDLATLL
ncbi:hypothetical protein ES703_114950 [subsurface metagenome]